MVEELSEKQAYGALTMPNRMDEVYCFRHRGWRRVGLEPCK